MDNGHEESGWNIGLGLGLGAVIGILVSAIIGMIQLSKPKDRQDTQETISASERATASPPKSPQVGQTVAVTDSPIAADGPDIAGPLPTSTSWSTGTKYFVSALLFLAFLGILYISSSSMSTIIFAALLTFIVHPIIKFFQRRLRMKRGGATVLTYLLVLALIIMIPFLIIPSIIEAIQFVANIDFSNLLQEVSEWVSLQSQSIATIPLVGRSLSSSLEEIARILGDLGSDNPPSSSTGIDVSFQNIGGRIAQTLEFLVRVFGPLISIATTVVFTLLISLHMSL